MKNEQFENCICETNILLSYITTMDTNEIVHINEPLKNLYGFEDESYVGKKCYDVLHGFYSPKKSDKLPILMIGKPYEWYKHNDYLGMHFALKDTLVEDEGFLYRLTIAYDITDEVDEISKLQDDVFKDKSIIKCAKTLLATDDIDESIDMLLSTVCEYHGADRAYIFEINYQEEYITNTYEFTNDDTESFIDDLEQVDFDELPNFIELLHSEKDLSIQSVEEMYSEDDPEYEFFNDQGVECILLTRLYRDGRVIGFLGVDNPTQNNNEELLSTVSAFIVNDLDKRRFTTTLVKTVKKLKKLLTLEETVLDCAKTLFDDMNIEVSINKVLEIITKYFRADRAYVFEIKDDTQKYMANTYEFCNGNVVSGMSENQHMSLDSFQRWFKDFEDGVKRIHIKSRETEIDKDTMEYQLLVNQNVFSFIIVQILTPDNELIGFLGLDNPLRNIQDIKLLDTASAFITNNIEKRDMILELEHLSYSDKLTGLQNRNCYLNSIENIKNNTPNTLGVVFGDVNGLKKANDKLGHEYGDILIKWCAKFLKRNLKQPVFRIGGDEFVCFIENMECEVFYNTLQQMRLELFNMGVINMSMGGTWHYNNIDIDKQIIETDKIMYLEKQKYYILKGMANKSLEEELEELKNIILKLEDDM